jgi:hypothetical protein
LESECHKPPPLEYAASHPALPGHATQTANIATKNVKLKMARWFIKRLPATGEPQAGADF